MSHTPWRHVQKRNFTQFEPLFSFLQLSLEDQKKVWQSPRFSLNLPYRLAAKMEKANILDPLFRQFVPTMEESTTTVGFSCDPVEDQRFRKESKLLHKYDSRALLLTTSACAMHCRFCFRQNFPYETKIKNFESEIAYLKSQQSISEVILSGGDPLSLSDQSLKNLLTDIDSISHIKRIRFHTRFPIGIPERIDESFLNVLQSVSKQIYFLVHCNHPNELDEEVLASFKKVLKLGIPVLSQTVLLHGINNDIEVLDKLFTTLVDHGVVPYYLHELDKVEGGAHFEVPRVDGQKLILELQERLSGYAVPRLVKEEPGKKSKTDLFTAAPQF